MSNRSEMNAPRLLYVVNIPRFFLSHRLSLALAARAAGFDVHVAASDQDQASIRQIRANGLPFHPLPLSQHGLNPLRELRALLALRRLYRDLQPRLLHHVSIKPVIYGGLAAQLSGCHQVVHAMSGLGYVFVSRELRARALRLASGPVFKLALRGRGARMIFQNPDDRRLFLDRGLITPERAILIRGSGVDTDIFIPAPESRSDKPVVLFAGRLLIQKGIGDFVEVARRLRGRALFRVVGYEEGSSPLNVAAEKMRAWQSAGLIEWLGRRDDMPRVYADSNIVCLPSTYGEGIPKVLLEAAACGRTCVTTDTPGCREVVRPGVNGMLVPATDIDALTAAVLQLIERPALRERMGAAGRQLVLERLSLRQVNAETVALYRSIMSTGVSS